jgi:hypothetical protein
MNITKKIKIIKFVNNIIGMPNYEIIQFGNIARILLKIHSGASGLLRRIIITLKRLITQN